jgi:hypothetical protein
LIGGDEEHNPRKDDSGGDEWSGWHILSSGPRLSGGIHSGRTTLILPQVKHLKM